MLAATSEETLSCWLGPHSGIVRITWPADFHFNKTHLMRQPDSKFPSWFLWIANNGPLVILITGALFLAMVAVAHYVDRQMSDQDGEVVRQPPREFQPPNLADYAADEIPPESIKTGATVYVPVYSHVYYDGGRPYSLETTLSIRNTDLNGKLLIDSVRYYDTDGKLAMEQVKQRIMLDPLETIEFLVEKRDSSGGSGANFIVQWGATEPISEPIIQAVMLGTSGTQAIVFQAQGQRVDSPRGQR